MEIISLSQNIQYVGLDNMPSISKVNFNESFWIEYGVVNGERRIVVKMRQGMSIIEYHVPNYKLKNMCEFSDLVTVHTLPSFNTGEELEYLVVDDALMFDYYGWPSSKRVMNEIDKLDKFLYENVETPTNG